MAGDLVDVPILSIEKVKPFEREADGTTRVFIRDDGGQTIQLKLTARAVFDLSMALMASPLEQIGDLPPPGNKALINVIGWGRMKSPSGNEVLQLAVSKTEALHLKFAPGALDEMLATLQSNDYQPGRGLSSKN